MLLDKHGNYNPSIKVMMGKEGPPALHSLPSLPDIIWHKQDLVTGSETYFSPTPIPTK